MLILSVISLPPYSSFWKEEGHRGYNETTAGPDIQDQSQIIESITYSSPGTLIFSQGQQVECVYFDFGVGWYAQALLCSHVCEVRQFLFYFISVDFQSHAFPSSGGPAPVEESSCFTQHLHTTCIYPCDLVKALLNDQPRVFPETLD